MNVDAINPETSKFTGWLAVFSIVALMTCNPSFADSAGVLNVQPKKCVVLRKGLKCYKKIRITFKMPEKGDYCIRLGQSNSPLKCWINSEEGKLSYVFNAENSVNIYLIRDDDVVIEENQFTVAWVYNKRRRTRNHWKLF